MGTGFLSDSGLVRVRAYKPTKKTHLRVLYVGELSLSLMTHDKGVFKLLFKKLMGL